MGRANENFEKVTQTYCVLYMLVHLNELYLKKGLMKKHGSEVGDMGMEIP